MPDITPEESRELKSRDLTPPMPDMNDRDRQAFEAARKRAYEVEVHWDLHDRHKIGFIDTDARDEYLYEDALAHARQQDAALLERCERRIRIYQSTCISYKWKAEEMTNAELLADIRARKAGG